MPFELHILRRFYKILTSLNVEFYIANSAKGVADEIYYRDPILSEKELFNASKKCLISHNFFIHIELSARSKLIVLDVDSVKNSQVVLHFNEMLHPSSPVYNLTPHGLHLFYPNPNKMKRSRLGKILFLCVKADIFCRGKVTVLGNGYSLFCSEKNPLEIKGLNMMPRLLFESSSTNPFVVSG